MLSKTFTKDKRGKSMLQIPLKKRTLTPFGVPKIGNQSIL